ncbi:putative RNA polymerase ECF-type sigma factor [metagenome]|uniref:Putative RNA polymerase ECF-type sigma factor n=1 Tax=metagenome TaxID=256318 RepID=A0A2P2BYB4_9ZZZZ
MRPDGEPIGSPTRRASMESPPAQPSERSASTLDELYAEHRGSLVRLAAVVCGDTSMAQDIVQDVFASLQGRGLEAIEDQRAYLYRATVNRARSWSRRLRTARRYLLARSAHTPQVPEPGEAVAIRTALAGLSHDHRAALFLRFYLDLPEAEIAEVLGCRPGTVKSRVARGLQRLKEALDDQD